jgi:hypothetical protein
MKPTLTRAALRALLLGSILCLAATGGLGCSTSSRTEEQPAGDAGTADAPPGAGDAGADAAGVLSETEISTVAGCTDEHEPTIAVAPDGHVALSFDAYCQNRAQIISGYRISNDFGATWGPATLMPLPAGDNEEGNSTVAADAQGNLYMAWAAESHTATRTDVHVFAAKAGPGATQFEAPVTVFDPPTGSAVDSPRIVVTSAGLVHVLFAVFSEETEAQYLAAAVSTDMTTWSVGPAVSGAAGDGNFARVCQAAGSPRIYLVFQSYGLDATPVDGTAVALSYSDDGKTWSQPLEVTLPDEEYETMYFLDCATDGTSVWVFYSLSPAANEAEVSSDTLLSEPPANRLRLAHSPDRGASIDWREDVGDPDALFLVPTFVGEGTSAVDLSFVTGSALEGPATVRWSRAADGKTFAPSDLVGSGLTLSTDRTKASWMGDYNGRAFSQGSLYLVYADNSSGSSHVDFYRTPVSEAAPSDAGVATDGSAVESFDAGFPSCLATQPFTPTPWAPPTPFGQGACSATQITSYVTCATSAGGNCSAFRAVTANAGCLACLETPASASQHGPMVMGGDDGGVAYVEMNTGGCVAHYDGDAGSSACGALTNASNDCFAAACGSCSDFANPSDDGPTYACYFASVLPGEACGDFLVSNACGNETLEGGTASACGGTLGTILTAWCGP